MGWWRWVKAYLYYHTVVIVVDLGQLSKKKENCGSQMANDVIMESDECTDQAQNPRKMNLTVNLRGTRVNLREKILFLQELLTE